MAERIYAIIPAAGKSTRMGRPKLSLPLGNRTVLECVIDAIREGGVRDVLVVLAPHSRELRPSAERAGAAVLLLDEETLDMRTTVERGLVWLTDHCHPDPNDAWLLAPADHPTLDSAVVRRLLAARAERPDRSLLVPTHAGKRGHPTLIEWQHVQAIRDLPQGLGLNAFLRARSAETFEVPVDTATILSDLDTPADYERLNRSDWVTR